MRLSTWEALAWNLVCDLSVNGCWLKWLQGRLIFCLAILNKLTAIWIFIELNCLLEIIYVDWWNVRCHTVSIKLAFIIFAWSRLLLQFLLQQLPKLFNLGFKSLVFGLKGHVWLSELLKVIAVYFTVLLRSYPVLKLAVFMAWKDLAHLFQFTQI